MLLFDVSNYFKVSRAVEGITSNQEQVNEMLCYMTPSYIESSNVVRKDVALIHWNSMGYTIS